MSRFNFFAFSRLPFLYIFPAPSRKPRMVRAQHYIINIYYLVRYTRDFLRMSLAAAERTRHQRRQITPSSYVRHRSRTRGNWVFSRRRFCAKRYFSCRFWVANKIVRFNVFVLMVYRPVNTCVSVISIHRGQYVYYNTITNDSLLQ